MKATRPRRPAAATALINDPQVIAVIGPAFSGESKAVNPSFCKATPSMPIVTASASNAQLQTQGNKCWHRIIPNDNVEGSQGADWLARTGSKKVFVLSDLSTYGAGVAGTMAAELAKKGVKVVKGGVDGLTTQELRPDRADHLRVGCGRAVLRWVRRPGRLAGQGFEGGRLQGTHRDR